MPRPPLESVEVSTTALGSGVLVNPGTINVPLGSGLEFTGDPNTLPCGGSSNNGKLTITVDTQEGEIKEPYGPGVSAIFGPYSTAQSLSYSITLKDSSCSDTVNGTVDIP